MEFDKTVNNLPNVLVNYSLDQMEENTRKPVHCPELGLAVEKLRDGYTMQSLWEVLPPQISTANQ